MHDARRPTVILLHATADGGAHYDWLIARDPRGREPLLAWRTSARPDRLEPGATLDLEAAPDHRPLYLTYEGPLAAAPGGRADVDRGSVTRVARGLVAPGPEAEAIEVVWDSGVAMRLAFAGTPDSASRSVRRLA